MMRTSERLLNLPAVKNEGDVVTVLTVLAVGVVNVVGVVVLSVTKHKEQSIWNE